MATNKALAPNIDNSDQANFPDARIKDDTGSGNGTPVNRLLYSDIHEFFAKLMRLAAITYNGVPDSEGTGYQLVDAAIALAGKNDFLTSLNTAAGLITVPLKLSTLKLNEMLICKAAVNYNSETQIKGSESAAQTVTVSSAYKANDYVRFIKTNTGITLVRLADSLNLDTLITELNFLKAANNAEELTGALTNKSTTPASNLSAFIARVNGANSSTYLATTLQNGLLSKEDKVIIDSFVSPVKNVGWISGVDPGGMSAGTPLARSGDIVSAIVQGGGTDRESFITVTFNNNMTGLNYFVRSFIESQGTINFDNDCLIPVFKPLTPNSFTISVAEHNNPGQTVTQSLKIHLEVVQIA